MPIMIKIVKAEHAGGNRIALEFSDHARGVYDLASMLQRDTVLTRPLCDEAYFKDFFLELGALCWRNGLELSPAAIYAQLSERGELQRPMETTQ